MWKKDEVIAEQPSPAPRVPSGARQTAAAPSRAAAPATIGSSITIRGEVSGDEDLLIEGHVDGSVDLGQHAVTVGAAGQVKAGITGRVVTVEGTVHGDLHAEEMVVLRTSAHVHGDIIAPRVVLEDGATFRGAVDMGGQAEKGRSRSGNGRSLGTKSESSVSNVGESVAASSRASGKASSGDTAENPASVTKAEAEA